MSHLKRVLQLGGMVGISSAVVVLVGCAGTAYVKYSLGSSDAVGYRFVIPRTVVKIGVEQEKGSPAPAAGGAPPSAQDNNGKAKPKLTATPVPSTIGADGKPLPVFVVTDDS